MSNFMSTTTGLRKNNTLVVLKTIMESESITKPDAAKKTGLTLMTVNTIMNSLLEKKIIIECGVAGSFSGRKSTLYTLNSAIYKIIGVNIGVGTVSIAVSDLSLKTGEIITLKTNTNAPPGEIIGLILDSVARLMITHNIEPANVLGMGVTVPGPVDAASGIIHSFPNLKGWADIPLKEILKEKLNIPVFAEKDNYASVLYLKRNLDNTYKNVVSLTIKGGIGTGILLGGKLFRGENGIAGEIGHVSVDMKGPRCNCGNFGCLEIYASDYAIIRNVKKSIKKHRKSGILCEEDGVNGSKKGDADDGLTDGVNNGINNDAANDARDYIKDDEIGSLDIERITKAALKGDELCRDAILKAAKYVGLAVSNAMKFYDPAYFIINSRWIKEIKEAQDIITGITRERCTLMQKAKINLAFFHEDDVYLMGALKLVREHVMVNIFDNRLIS